MRKDCMEKDNRCIRKPRQVLQLLYLSILLSGSFNLHSQLVNSPNAIKRDIGHDLKAVIPDNALNNDDVIEITINPDWNKTQDIEFQIIEGQPDIFALENSKLIVKNNSNLSSGNYKVNMLVWDGDYYDTFTVNISVIPSNKCVFINPKYSGPEEGTRNKPYNSIHDASFQVGYYYFVARSACQLTDKTINVVSDMLLGAYGKGPRPVISSSAYNAVYVSVSSNNATIRDLRIKHCGSRSIQIDAADRITIDNCHLGDPHNSRVDVAIRSDGLTSYTKILNCRIDSVDSDGIYLENEFAEIAYNTITNVSINNNDGDCVQLAINTVKAHVHHNYLDMGNCETVKGVIDNSQGQNGGYGWDSYAVFEYNILIASSGHAGYGICSTGRYDTVRCNFIYVQKSAVEAAAVNLADGGYVANNIIKGWERGVYTRGDDLVIYNNTITDCLRGIDDNTTAPHTLVVKNNIFHTNRNCLGNHFILSASANTLLVSDHNLFSPSNNAKWIYKGVVYLTFDALRKAGYEQNSIYDDPKFLNAEGNYRLAEGSPCIKNGEELVKIDFYGNPRPKGVPNDIGACAYGTSNESKSGTKEQSNMVYIDPNNISDPLENGSLSHPFDSWSDVTWKSGKVYVQKRGTTAPVGKILISADDVTLEAYGEGESPIIISETSTYVISAFQRKDLIIKDLHIKGTKAVSCIYFLGNLSDNITIEHCILDDASNAIRIAEGKNFTIKYNSISRTNEGIYSTATLTKVFYNIFKNNENAINVMSNISKTEIYNNVFFNNIQSVSVSYAELVLYNNIFYFTDVKQKAIKHGSGSLNSDHNIFYPEQDGFIEVGNTFYNKLDRLQQELKVDLHSFNKDPLFVNVYNENFELDASSPAINSGVNLNLTEDIAGNNVPYDEQIDIGVYEYTGYLLKDKELTNEKTTLTVYPNPSTGLFNVIIETLNANPTNEIQLRPSTIRVVDLSGKTKYSKNIENTEKSITEKIDLSGFANGFYYVVFQLSNKVLTEKLILSL